MDTSDSLSKLPLAGNPLLEALLMDVVATGPTESDLVLGMASIRRSLAQEQCSGLALPGQRQSLHSDCQSTPGDAVMNEKHHCSAGYACQGKQ